MRADLNASFRRSKTCAVERFYWSFLDPFLSKAVRSTGTELKPWMNLWENLANPRNFCSSLTVVGMGQYLMAVSLFWSVRTPSSMA